MSSLKKNLLSPAGKKKKKSWFAFSFIKLHFDFFFFKVHIINLLQDSKFHHFKPVMDTYIESHFAGALAYR